uniref:Uncharacterized protein n=1 Tax=Zea mays TaxID=4577 RepID=B7ZZE8_MAIZE|nr:unknown [Zea mays]
MEGIYSSVPYYVQAGTVLSCMRMRRSLHCRRVKRLRVYSWRSLSTSARSSGVPAAGSNSHTSLPRKPLGERSSGLLGLSPIFSLHMLG